MAALSEATWEKVRGLFPQTQHDEVAAILQNQCGNNLPFLEKETPEGLERFRFAALKLSRGKMDKPRRGETRQQGLAGSACGRWLR